MQAVILSDLKDTKNPRVKEMWLPLAGWWSGLCSFFCVCVCVYLQILRQNSSRVDPVCAISMDGHSFVSSFLLIKHISNHSYGYLY